MIFNLRETAFRGYVQSYRVILSYRDLDNLFSRARNEIYNFLVNSQKFKIRLLISLNVVFVKSVEFEELVRQSFYFNSFPQRIYSQFQILQAIDGAFDKLKNDAESFISNGSGWAIECIPHLDVHIGRIHTLRGGCENVELPTILKKKNVLL